MWGNILVDSTIQSNFFIGFSNNKSDVLIHLTQWQYWWWFWFSFVWVLYYLLILKIIRKQTLKFKPRIVTSFRPHGKWGDLLVCLIPLSWCINILINSNFLLKLIEWQNESSLFTVRIRAKQWYWLYKFDLRNTNDVISAPKNIGNDNWVVNHYNTVNVSNNYINSLQIRSKKLLVNDYWNVYNEYKSDLKNKQNINNILELNFKTYISSNDKSGYIRYLEILPIREEFFLENKLKDFSKYNNYFFLKNNFYKDFSKYNFFFYDKLIKIKNNNTNYFVYKNNNDMSTNTNYRSKDNTFSLNALKKSELNRKSILLDFTIEEKKIKPFNEMDYLMYRQKRKTKDQKIVTSPNSISIRYAKDSVMNYNDLDFLSVSDMFRKNKKKTDNVNMLTSRRMLRTKRSLVLPSHVNITAITNSYDVVHSWFIPGLGLKFDCIPGRATHHTFYIDNVGFYYGQCAEICGRYHHHMPIRLCAIPFEHFVIWWQNFGINKYNFKFNSNKTYSFRKYNW